MTPDDTLAPVPTALEQILEPPRDKKGPLIIFLIIFCLVFFFIGASISAPFLIAYQIIPIHNESITTPVEEFIMNFSFMPKTPRYILRHIKQTQADVNTFSLNASFDFVTESISPLVGKNNLPIIIQGPVDLTNPDNSLYSWDVSLGKDFNMHMVKDKENQYIRFITIPTSIADYIHLNQDQLGPYMNQWVSYGNKEKKTPSYAAIHSYITQNVLPDIPLVQKKIDGAPIYSFQITLTQERVLSFMQTYTNIPIQKDGQLLFSIAEGTLHIIVNAGDYHIKTISFGVKGEMHIPSSMVAPPPSLSFLEVPSFADKPFTLSGKISFSDINVLASFMEPTDVMSLDTFIDDLSKQVVSAEAFESSNAQKLKGTKMYEELETLLTLETAILHYYYDHDAMPAGADELLASSHHFTDDARKKVQEDLDNEHVLFLRSGDGRSIFIVTTEKDEGNEKKPYRGILLYKGESSKLQHFSAGEVNQLNESFKILGSN